MTINQTFVETITGLVENSYAHNNLIYRYIEKSAPFNEIFRMQKWNSALSELITFDKYLAQWMERIPEKIKFVFLEHLREEEQGEHSRYYREMIQVLQRNASIEVTIDRERLRKLNYTYSTECANEQDVGFFLGGFFATETMSARRSQQLYNGFRRVGIPDESLEYLKIHLEADCHHADEIGQRMILPILEDNPQMSFSILKGLEDRLSRSARHLIWYESQYLPSSV